MTQTAQIKKVRCDFSDRELYNPVYIPLFHNKSEFIHLFGSAGSGKSRFEAQRKIAKSFDWKRKKRKSLIIRKVGTTLKDSVFAEMETVIYEWNLLHCFNILKSPLSITNKLTGVQCIFKGLDDPEKIKSISGVDDVWIEEATELGEKKELDQLRLRLRGFSDVQITLSYNPIDEYHWLNTEIHQQKPPGHFLLHTTYKDNLKMLAKDRHYASYIEGLEETNPNYFRVYGKGLWGRVLEGLIYENYTIVDDFPKDEFGKDDIQFYGLDFGYSDPTALVAMNVQDASPKKKLITKEILYKSGLDGIGLVAEFDKLNVRKDVLIIGDSARPEMIATLKNAGYKVKGAEKGAGSVLTGINRVRKYQICIVAGSKNGIKEIQNYQKKESNGIWFEEPAPNQVEHYWDAVRYGEQATGIHIPDFDETVEEDQEW